MLKAELIEKNKNLIQQNGELLYLLEFGKLRCEDSKLQMIWEHDSNARVLQQRIDKAKIELSTLMSRYFYEEDFYIEDTHLDEILKTLDGGNNGFVD